MHCRVTFFSLFRNLQEKKEEIEVLERKCFSSKVQLESSFLSEVLFNNLNENFVFEIYKA